MLETAIHSLVVQRVHVALSSDHPPALHQAASALLRRLEDEQSVHVADEAPIDPGELIEHVNRIVATLPLREATEGAPRDSRPAILPVRVGADRSADSITLLARLCRALPGSGLRLLLIVENRDALGACLSALGQTGFHWEIESDRLSEHARPVDADERSEPSAAQRLIAAIRDAQRAETGRASQPTSQRSSRAAASVPAPLTAVAEKAAQAADTDDRGDTPAIERTAARTAGPLEQEQAATPPSAVPTVPAAAGTGLFTRLADSAARRPLRFALLVAGIPGLLIAGMLALGTALHPSRSSTSGSATSTSSAPSARPPAPATGTQATQGATPPRGAAPAAASGGRPESAPAAATAPPASQASPTGSGAPRGGNSPSGEPPAKAPAGSGSPPPPAAPRSNAPAPPAASGTPTPSATSLVAATSATNRAAQDATSAAANPAAPSSQPPFACSAPGSPPPQVQPRNPSKDGSMVYLTSNRLITVCVTDASGATERHDLLPEQGGRSFFGKPPWQVQASSLRDLQVFFQGSKIAVPRNATDRFELVERTN